MLYIKFNNQSPSKFEDFLTLYQHMVTVRQPNFSFEEEEPEPIEWEKLSQDEVDKAVEKLCDFIFEDPAAKRYQRLIPEYANGILMEYLKIDNERLGELGIEETLSIFNYLEFGFEVDFTNLELNMEQQGIIEFSTLDYPFGGIDRFLMVLKAFDILPTECFDGFNVFRFDWTNKFEYNAIDLPEKTTAYIKSYET